MSRTLHVTSLAVLGCFLVLGCSSQREFTGWSIPKLNPLSWWKKDQPPAAVTKPSEIAGVPRPQTQPGYASVSSGVGSNQPPTYGVPPSASYPPSTHTSPAPTWPAPSVQPPSYGAPNQLPGPQVGYYGSQSTPATGVRVADRSGSGMPQSSSHPAYGGYAAGWNSGGNVPTPGASSYSSPSSYQPPSGAWNPPTAPPSTLPTSGSPQPAGYSPAPWQVSDTPSSSLGPRYDINASRYNLSGAGGAAPASSPAASTGSPNSGNPWGYNSPTITPAPGTPSVSPTAPPGGTGNTHNFSGTSPYSAAAQYQPTASPAGGLTGTSAGQVQPAGFNAGAGVAAGATSAQTPTAGGAQGWNPGGPTPNMPGRVDYQPGNTGYQPGVTGYQPPSSAAGVDSAQPGSGTRTGSGTTSGGTSPFLPGSIRPYVPPTSSGNNTAKPQAEAGSSLSLASLPAGTGSQGNSSPSFCTLDGKCQ